MTSPTILLMALGAVAVESQQLTVTVDPAAHQASVEARLVCRGSGPLALQLTDAAAIDHASIDGRGVDYKRTPGALGSAGRVELDVPAGGGTLTLAYRARMHDEVEASERPNAIHNFAVEAHLGDDGIFLSDGSAWHPRPLDADGRPALHLIKLTVRPIDGWALVASGEPAERDIDRPGWTWYTPRPVDGMALAGNRHTILGRVHSTAHGPVEVVMHVSAANAGLAPLFLDAACAYLDLYVPLLGPFPYRRFTITENFFSSGFAYPGFTLLGPRVVAMAPRSLAPGYLDHELLHNWWGNGVYVDPSDGNWCEALTTFGANYYRRVAEGGEEAGREWRRGVLSMASSDPTGRDDGALGAFGSADPSVPGPDRFVGYDKGAFVFAMLADVLEPVGSGDSEVPPVWQALRRFAERHMGRRASWRDIQEALEAQAPERQPGWLDGFFRLWVREHTVPRTIPGEINLAPGEFAEQFAAAAQPVRIDYGPDRAWCEIDPEFRLYRLLPPEQIVPTISGTFGPGGLRVLAGESRPELEAFLTSIEQDAAGENLLLVGAPALREAADLIAQTADPVSVEQRSFTVGGRTYGGAEHSMIHTMAYPGRPGRFISVFLSNGETGWSRLRTIRFYTRDTTVVWEGDSVIDRRAFEPDRRLRLR